MYNSSLEQQLILGLKLGKYDKLREPGENRHMPVILAQTRLRQKNCKFTASLGYKVRLSKYLIK